MHVDLRKLRIRQQQLLSRGGGAVGTGGEHLVERIGVITQRLSYAAGIGQVGRGVGAVLQQLGHGHNVEVLGDVQLLAAAAHVGNFQH